MEKFANLVVKHKKVVLILSILLALFSAVGMIMVRVNYDMVDYLPKEAQSTTAISIMEEEFGGDMPNARVMISGVTVQEALTYKDRLAAIDGVSSVSWLDDAVGEATLTTTPVEYLDPNIVESYYTDSAALYSVSIESGHEKAAVAAIRDLVGEDNAIAGNAVNTAAMQEMSVTEVMNAMGILLPVILVILLLYTTSWIEPLLFLAAIGVAVMINLGTNVFLGEISFITQTVSPILQLAVSLDYAIFLLHSFNSYREKYQPEEAMRKAIKKAVASVAASAATTVVGFLALLFMRFGIGADLGLNLVKGVLLSFVSVMIFLPALTLSCYKLIDRTRHRSFLPSFRGVGKVFTKISAPFLILAILVSVPCFLAQSGTDFQYGMGGITAATRAGADQAAIEENFSGENMLVLLVPRGDAGSEAELAAALGDVPHVTTVVAYVTAVGSEIPPEYLSDEITDQFYSEHYARIILYTDMAEEGEETFTTVRTILDTASGYYGEYWLAGQSATLYDMKNVVSADTTTVNIAAIVGIILILLITFRSPVLPVLLTFTIETAIWVNLSFAYFTGQSYNFIGYLVISTVQLGATVDYAILMTDRYLHNREKLSKREAMQKALGENIIAVLISAAILSTAGFTLAMTSSNSIIAELGTLLGRGTLLSLLMVALVLPALLMLFDGPNRKLTLRLRGKQSDNE